MKIDLKKLPEKDYFSFEEIAERWSCELETIYHYIYEKRILYPAISTIKEGINAVCSRSDENYSEYEKLSKLLYGMVDLGKEIPHRIVIPLKDNNRTIQEMIDSINFEPLKQCYVWGKRLPSFLYQVPSELIPYPDGTNYRMMMEGKNTWGFYISARDISGKRYTLLSHLNTPRVYPVTPKMFNLIPKEERDRFEKEYGITENSVNVQNRVSKKTENLYLELIQVFAEVILGDELTDKPHSNAAKIDRLLSKKRKNLPCTTETLANYLNN